MLGVSGVGSLLKKIFLPDVHNGSPVIVMSANRTVCGEAVPQRAKSAQLLFEELKECIGKHVTCEGKHRRRDWKDAVVIGVRLSQDEVIEFELIRDEPNAKTSFSRLFPDQISLERSSTPRRKKPRLRGLRHLVFSAFSPAA